MIISSISLQNIRSYKNQTINFKEGITFLQGDIGSGKSSLLLSIEFALFGFKRGDLEGIHLLRKGEKEASVKLEFKNGNENIEIFRKIKKNKSSISQEVGYIKIGSDLQELSPTELTTHIFDLFNFPKEFISKDKNLLYRFSTYTPQEQLKEILFTEDEKRLEVIRKLFSIDKYKQLQIGIDIYLKKLKEKKLKLQGSLEQKKEVEEKYLTNSKDLESLEKNIKDLETKFKPIEEKILKVEDILKSLDEKKENIIEKKLKLEKQIIKIEELKNISSQTQKEIKEKKEYLERLEKENKINTSNNYNQKVLDLQKEIKKFQEELILLKEKQKEFEKKKLILNDKTQKEEINLVKIKSLKENLFLNDPIKVKCEYKDLEVKAKPLGVKLRAILKKEKKIEILEKEILEVSIEIKELKVLIETQTQTLNLVENNNSCTLCQQEISHTHKANISSQINIKLGDIKTNLSKKEVLLDKSQKEVIGLKEAILDKKEIESNIILIESKINELKEKETKFLETSKQIKEGLVKLKDENEKLKKEISKENLKEFDSRQIEELEKSLDKNKSNLTDILLKSQNQKNLTEKIESLKKEIEILENKEKVYKPYFEKLPKALENKEKIIEKEKLIFEKFNQVNEKKIILKNKEKSYLTKISAFNAQLKEKTRQQNDLRRVLDKLEEKSRTLEKFQKLTSFLEDKAIVGAKKIEMILFTSFYVQFNEYFEKYFKELIEDQELDVRLDENFSILVEQNGYDIDIKNLSGGEKSSLAIAYKLALNNIIEEHLGSKSKLDFLILDEPTDGFSDAQVSRLGLLLKESNSPQIFLVSHDNKVEAIADNKISIEKISHESKVSF